MAALVLAYYRLVRSILKARPALRPCLCRCRHCRIFFLTHPRNARRHDLRCPFGCREAHRKACSTRRSVAYYRDGEAGRQKKRQQNARRRHPILRPVSAPQAPLPWPRPILEYVRVVTGLIEGRPVSWAEVLEMLARTVRQHRMVRERRGDQIVVWLHGHPP